MRQVLVCVICAVVLLASGCDPAAYNGLYDDEVGIAAGDSYFAKRSAMNVRGDELTWTATFSGVDTVWEYTAKQDEEAELFVSLSVSEGEKAKLVLVTPDEEVTTLVENADRTQSDELQRIPLALQRGKNQIKMAGYGEPRFTLNLICAVGHLGSDD